MTMMSNTVNLCKRKRIEAHKMNRDFKGIWIPKEIWLNDSLSIQAKCLWAEIDSLYDEDHGGCYASDEYLADFLGTKLSRFKEVLKELRDFGLVENVSFNGRQRVVKAVTFKIGGEQLAGKPATSQPENRLPPSRKTGHLPTLSPYYIENKDEIKEREREGAAPSAPASSFIERTKNVATTNEEHQKLLAEYGEVKTNAFYQILSDWKEDTPRAKWKKNDYRSILRWVVKAESERKTKSSEGGNSKEDAILAQKIWDRYKGRKECDIELGYKYIEFKNGQTVENLEFGCKDFRIKCLEQLTKRKLNREGL